MDSKASISNLNPQDETKAETETTTDRLTTSKVQPASAFLRKRVHEIHSKYSGSRKSSEDTTGLRRQIRMENTFRLSPEDNQRFIAYKIQPRIEELISEKVTSCQKNNSGVYNAKTFAILTRELADNIRREAKNLGIQRYKIVAHVVVGQNFEQDTRVASRCLWNTDFDNSITVTFNLNKIFVVASLYVLYSE
jgi:hypothetical protein